MKSSELFIKVLFNYDIFLYYFVKVLKSPAYYVILSIN